MAGKHISEVLKKIEELVQNLSSQGEIICNGKVYLRDLSKVAGEPLVAELTDSEHGRM